MNRRRGISKIIAIIIILVVTSTLTVSFGYFSGFIFNRSQTSEYLELSNATIWDVGEDRAIKFLVKNIGNKDASIEYIVFNGDIMPYASKMFGEWIPYNFMESEYLIIPYDSQVEMYIPYETNEESLEIRLHTLTGNDFTKVLSASSLQTEYEGQSQTLFEQIEIQFAVCTYDTTKTQWIVILSLKNTGTATATLINVFINDIEVDKYTYSNPTPNGDAETDMTTSKSLGNGDSATIMVYIDQNWRSVTAGTTVNIKIHSADGMDYIKLIELIGDSPFTKFEQVEIQTGVCTIVDTNWQVQISLKNTGTGAATLTNVFVNDVEVVNPTGYGVTAPTGAVATITTDMTVATAYSLQSGQSGSIKVWIGSTYAMLSPGTTVNIKIHSAGGMDYIKLIELV